MRDGVPLTLRTVLRDAAAWLRTELEDESVPGLLWCYLNRKDSYTVWTDSPNAFHHASGRIPPPPVAPVALQAEAFDAASALAELAEHEPGLGVEPDEARAWARRLRELVLAEAVVETPKGPFLANGLVAEGEQKRLRPLAVRTVGMGIALDSDLLRGPDAAAVREGIVQHLSSPAMTSPFGIVGRARDEVRYTPFDYHAQVWAFASYRVAAGLRHHGFEEAAIDLEDRILRQTRDGLLPENVGAGPEDELRYCAHLLTVRRPAADGRITETVKERPPAPYAAWTTGAVIAITQGRGGVQQHDD
jgi:glycogen debranching enzyme